MKAENNGQSLPDSTAMLGDLLCMWTSEVYYPGVGIKFEHTWETEADIRKEVNGDNALYHFLGIEEAEASRPRNSCTARKPAVKKQRLSDLVSDCLSRINIVIPVTLVLLFGSDMGA
jgi:hypothetical protein